MMTATLSFIGLYNFDATLFDGMELPQEIDRKYMISELLSRTAGMEVMYPDPLTMKSILTTWSWTRIDAWKKSITALTSEYNAIHNFDRYEENSDIIKDKHTQTSKNSDTGTASTSVNAWNDRPNLAERNKTTTSGNVEGTITNTSDDTHNHTAHMYGNIGITTSQQMINAELELRKTSIYDIVINDIIQRFCLLIY